MSNVIFLDREFAGHKKFSENEVSYYFLVIMNYFNCADYVTRKEKGNVDGFYNRLAGALDVGEELQIIDKQEKEWITKQFEERFL